MTHTAFGMVLAERGFEKKRKASGYYYQGIRLLTNEDLKYVSPF